MQGLASKEAIWVLLAYDDLKRSFRVLHLLLLVKVGHFLLLKRFRKSECALLGHISNLIGECAQTQFTTTT
jgi:hypothetical protein